MLISYKPGSKSYKGSWIAHQATDSVTPAIPNLLCLIPVGGQVKWTWVLAILCAVCLLFLIKGQHRTVTRAKHQAGSLIFAPDEDNELCQKWSGHSI